MRKIAMRQEYIREHAKGKGGKKKMHGIKIDAKRLRDAEAQEISYAQEVFNSVGRK